MVRITMIVESHEQVEHNLQRVLTDPLDRTHGRIETSMASILACSLRGFKDPHRPVTVTLTLEQQAEDPLPQPIDTLAIVC